MAFAAGSGKWRLLNDSCVFKFAALNNSAGALTSGTAVKYSSGTMAALDDSNTIGVHGVLEDDAAATSGVVGLQADGWYKVDVNGTINFAIDDPVYSYTGGLVDTGTTNDKEVGRIAPGADPANGASQVEIIMRSLFFIRDLLAHA